MTHAHIAAAVVAVQAALVFSLPACTKAETQAMIRDARSTLDEAHDDLYAKVRKRLDKAAVSGEKAEAYARIGKLLDVYKAWKDGESVSRLDAMEALNAAVDLLLDLGGM